MNIPRKTGAKYKEIHHSKVHTCSIREIEALTMVVLEIQVF